MRLFMTRGSDNHDFFLVFDEKQLQKYKVTVKNSNFGKRFFLVNSEGANLASIHKLTLPLLSIYTLKIKKLEFSLTENRIHGKPNYYINGINWTFKNFNKPHCFSVLDSGFEVLFGQLKDFGENYKIEIFKEEFEIECLSICVCVNNILIDDSRASIKACN